MKKYLSILFIAIFALALTGCGKTNTLTCTKYGEKYVITFSGNQASKVTTTETMNTEEEAKAYEAMYALYKEDGMSVKANGKKVEITYDLKKRSDDNNPIFKGTKEEIKKAAEEEGWSCK